MRLRPVDPAVLRRVGTLLTVTPLDRRCAAGYLCDIVSDPIARLASARHNLQAAKNELQAAIVTAARHYSLRDVAKVAGVSHEQVRRSVDKADAEE